MLKRALLATAVLAATSGVAFANGGTYAPVPVETHEGGFYIGAAISRDVADFETSFTNDAFFNDDFVNHFDFSYDQGTSQGINGEIFGGYGMLFNDHYYIAAEIWGSISSLKGDFNITDTFFDDTRSVDVSYRMNNTFGIALLPGVKLSDSTLSYLRIGYVNSRFKSEVNTLPTLESIDSLAGTDFEDFFNHNKNEGGIQLGLGMETMVTNNVSIRAEYDYNRYGRITRDRVDLFSDDDGDTLELDSQFSVRPVVDQFKLAAIYHFYS